jgi:hypothetical protein
MTKFIALLGIVDIPIMLPKFILKINLKKSGKNLFIFCFEYKHILSKLKPIIMADTANTIAADTKTRVELVSTLAQNNTQAATPIVVGASTNTPAKPSTNSGSGLPTVSSTSPATATPATAPSTPLVTTTSDTFASTPIPNALDAAFTRNDNISALNGGSESIRPLFTNAQQTNSTVSEIRTTSMLVDANAKKVYVEARIPKEQVDRMIIRNPTSGQLEFKGNTYAFNNLPAGTISYNPNKPENQPAISMNADGSASVKYVYDINDATKLAGYLEAKFTSVQTGVNEPATTSATPVAKPFTGTVTTTGSVRLDFGGNEGPKLTGTLITSDTNGNSTTFGGAITATTTPRTVTASNIAGIGMVNVATRASLADTSQSPNMQPGTSTDGGTIQNQRTIKP